MSFELEHVIGCNLGVSKYTASWVPQYCVERPDMGGVPQTAAQGMESEHRIASAAGGNLSISKLEDCHDQKMLQGHDDFIDCLAISPGGTLAATGQRGQNADVIVWDLDSSKLKFRFQEHDCGVACVAFSYDDLYLVSCGGVDDQRLFVWDMNTGLIVAWASTAAFQPMVSLMAAGMVRDIKRRNTSDYLFITAGGHHLTCWHVDVSGRMTPSGSAEVQPNPISTSSKGYREYTCLAMSDDREVLFAGTTAGDVYSALMKNRVLQNFYGACGGKGGVLTLCYVPCAPAPDERASLLVGGGDGSVSLFGVQHTELFSLRKIQLDGRITSLSLRADTRECLIGTDHGYLFRLKTRVDLPHSGWMESPVDQINTVGFVKGVSNEFISCSESGLVSIWSLDTYRSRMRILPSLPSPAKLKQLRAVSVDGNKDYFVVAYQAREPEDRLSAGAGPRAPQYTMINGFTYKEGRQLWSIPTCHRGDGPSALEVSRNARFILSGGTEGEVRVWQLKTKDMVGDLREHAGRVNAVRLLENDQYALSCSRDRSILSWDLRAERRLTCHRQRHGGVNDIVVGHDQVTVVAGGQERTMVWWDLRQPNPAHVLEAEEEIHTLALNHDDTLVASGGTGRCVKLWDSRRSGLLNSLPGHASTIRSVSFSPDGKQIVSGGSDNSIMVWNVYGASMGEDTAQGS